MRVSHHFGLCRVDYLKYDRWDGLLKNPRRDAAVMSTIATLAGFSANAWFDRDCTVNRLRKILDDAQNLNAPDTLMISFSGHGTMDEAFCCFDGLFYDYELHNRISMLRCRTVVIADSCHAGGMDRDYDPRLRKRVMPAALAVKRADWPPLEKDECQSPYLLLAACGPQEFALDGYGDNGVFTECLSVAFEAANNARQNFTWREWLAAAAGRCALEYPTQTPVLKLHSPDANAFADSVVMS